MNHRRVPVFLGSLLVVSCAACEMGAAADSTAGSSASTPSQLGIFEPGQLPNPCELISTQSVGSLIKGPASPVEGEPMVVDGDPLLFRTCTWGDAESRLGAIGIQIGVPDLSGHDVVANRSLVMEPSLESSIGDDGKETMNVGVLPTGGAKGATIFFRHLGYSVLIGHVGPGSARGTVEDLAQAVIVSLDA